MRIEFGIVSTIQYFDNGFRRGQIGGRIPEPVLRVNVSAGLYQ